MEEQVAASAMDSASPVARGERIASIDVLRGFALLGILVMNIPFFALSQYTWSVPPVDGGFAGVDYAVWHVSELFFNMKMMAIFSMLFGAGMVIFTERAEAKGIAVGRLHYKRMLWLLLIGLVHAYAIWFGDILVAYATCGCIAYIFRKLPGRVLVVLGPVVMSVAVVLSMPFGAQIEQSRTAMLEAQAIVDAGGTLNEEQDEALTTWSEEFEAFYPTEALLEEERLLHAEGGIDLLITHAPEVLFMQTFMMLFWGIWRVGGLMLLGMGLFKLRVFDASKPLWLYGAMTVVGYGVGLTIITMGIRELLAHEFDAAAFFSRDNIWNYVGSVFVALGHVGLLMAICKLGMLRWLTAALAAVGRMALTNYLMQSLICTFLFYWWGLGLWGTLDRGGLMLVVGGIWLFQLIVSPIWLSRFRFGPMEWVWRSLTYWKRQPMRIVGD